MEKDVTDHDKHEVDKYIKDVVLGDMQKNEVRVISNPYMHLGVLIRHPEILDFYENEIASERDSYAISIARSRLKIGKR